MFTLERCPLCDVGPEPKTPTPGFGDYTSAYGKFIDSSIELLSMGHTGASLSSPIKGYSTIDLSPYGATLSQARFLHMHTPVIDQTAGGGI